MPFRNVINGVIGTQLKIIWMYIGQAWIYTTAEANIGNKITNISIKIAAIWLLNVLNNVASIRTDKTKKDDSKKAINILTSKTILLRNYEYIQIILFLKNVPSIFS